MPATIRARNPPVISGLRARSQEIGSAAGETADPLGLRGYCKALRHKCKVDARNGYRASAVTQTTEGVVGRSNQGCTERITCFGTVS